MPGSPSKISYSVVNSGQFRRMQDTSLSLRRQKQFRW